ncbi:cytochrome c3 family protein [Photobacterium aphoticum]|uniref:Deca-heme c-type cytochrome n=1 Tax=Photobacterium aphoticum TaxID=754436 RepID=A0A0J1GG44_9GAMM|nr:cytochrome c3 family protein [Photobacterium aphoticum]KLU98478.1 deca-heme c-type cytochrome [Photobacterium aphoticum]PSU57423.1 tetratricopeptide repeat protein [Photobacterium aphoticum]
MMWLMVAIGTVKAASTDYVGSQTCVGCHQDAAEAWQGSHHDKAMQHATVDSVLGNFNNDALPFNGGENRFFRKGEEYWVYIAGSDGQFRDYQIRYTFGYYPLQQYMVAFPDGRIQLIPFAWDTRPESEGGQRWFHLYPDQTTTDPFFWTNTGQNWNHMCADCHSTNLQKNYDADKDRYDTTYSDINVGCEACHGPGKTHVDWAKQTVSAESTDHFGLTRDVKQAVRQWVHREGSNTLQPQSIEPTDQVVACAQCHSRRTQLTESPHSIHGAMQGTSNVSAEKPSGADAFLEQYRLSLITDALYYPDGQIFDEDYVYGSFLQSKMAKKGVTCTNCHDPHTAKLKMPEPALCQQCHNASDYSPQKHTFHAPDSEASTCTSCHMMETVYMQVDPRRDHSWQVPRPDLSQYTGAPNACTQCHSDQTDKWAAKQLREWFPKSQHQNPRHFSIAFYANAIGHPDAMDALAYTAQDGSESDIIRASALARLAGNAGDPRALSARQQNRVVALGRAVKHDSALIRLGAIAGSDGFGLAERWQIISPLLADPVLSVRSEAAGALVAGWSSLSDVQRQQLAAPLAEYMEIQYYNADRGFGRTNMGNVYRAQGHVQAAITAYQGAIAVEPYFENSYVNLADLYREQGNEQLALQTLIAGMKAQPKSSALPFSAGLALLRQGPSSHSGSHQKEALAYLQQAAERAASNARYWYVYGLALESQDVMAASESLGKAFAVSGNPQHLYAQCEVLSRNRQEPAVAEALHQCLITLGQYVPAEVIKQLQKK